MENVASLISSILLGFNFNLSLPATLDVFLSSSVNNRQFNFAAKLATDELCLLIVARYSQFLNSDGIPELDSYGVSVEYFSMSGCWSAK